MAKEKTSLARRINILRASVMGANDGIISVAGIVIGVAAATSNSYAILINISRKSRDFSHGMDRPLLSPFMGLFVCFCIFLVIDIFLDNFFAHIAQCTHIVTRRPKMTAPILATSYFWMIL